MTVGSMFTGIGGLDLGFERAGFEVRWMVESDPFCRAVLAKHWPGVPVYPDARMSVSAWEQVEPVDVIIGGFPCQDVSSAGLRRGLSGDRSGLWWCMRRAARVVRPRYVVVENVTGLLVRGIDTVLGSVAKLGFDAEWATVRASDVQAPHRRARVFIVAYPQPDARRDVEQRHQGGPAGDGQEPREASARGVADTPGHRLRGGRLTQSARQRRAQRREFDRCRHPFRVDAAQVGDAPGRRRGGGDAERLGTPDAGEAGSAVADAHGEPGRCGGANGVALHGSAALRLGPQEPRRRGAAVADAAVEGPQGSGPHEPPGGRWPAPRAAHGTGEPPAWPAGPGEPQHAWEPPRTVPSRRAQSALGAHADGVPVDVAGRRGEPASAASSAHVAVPVEKPGWRRAALRATGNSVVPQVAEVIARRILDLARA